MLQPLNWIANLTVSTLFPIVFQSVGRATYLIFVGELCAAEGCVSVAHPIQMAQLLVRVAGLTFFFGWFTLNKIPETKGKTIAQVTKEFEKY